MTHALIIRWRTLAGSLAASILALAGCKESTGSIQPAPEQGQVNFIHVAWPQASNTLQLIVDNGATTGLAYGESTSAVPFATGSHTVKINGASVGTVQVSKDVVYTGLLKPGTAGTLATVELVTDDLTTPASGQAGFRLLDATTAATPPVSLRLAQAVTSSSGTTYTPIAASTNAFFDYPVGVMTLVVLDGSNRVVAQVGTSSRRYEASHLYTVIAAGQPGAADPAAQPRAFLVVNK